MITKSQACTFLHTLLSETVVGVSGDQEITTPQAPLTMAQLQILLDGQAPTAGDIWFFLKNPGTLTPERERRVHGLLNLLQEIVMVLGDTHA